MNVLELFAGIGGLGLGLERAGMTIVGQVEIDPFCRAVLRQHWPEVPKHGDVRTAPEWWRSRPRPRVDVVCGGPPCQPASNAGARKAQDDPRWLWPEFGRVVREIRPRFVVVENVVGLLARGFGDVLGDLAAFGYDAEWDCIPASAVGAPHIRDRVFVVAELVEPSRGVPDAEREPVRVERERDREQHGEPRPAVARFDGSNGDVADADGEPDGRSPGDAVTADSGEAVRGRPAEPRGRGGTVADSVREGLPFAEHERTFRGPVAKRGWWSVEPSVGRVAYGVPDRVDRLTALGNAVVPLVAEHIGQLIMHKVEAASAAEVSA